MSQITEQPKNPSFSPGTHTIHVTTLGRTLNLKQSDEDLIHNKGAIKFRDAYQLVIQSGEAWLFNYAVLVCWNVDENDRQRLLNELKNLVQDPPKNLYAEQFSYSIEAGSPFKIHNDAVMLPNDDSLTRLAVSHAFAQSSKLVTFEEQAEKVIKDNSYISKELSRTGSIPLNRKKLAKLRGTLFEVSSDISLHFNLLDTPEFFWNYPELEEYYVRTAKYLDLQARIEILNHKLTDLRQSRRLIG